MSKDYPAPGADGLNLSEDSRRSLGVGVGTRPVRKRGFWRALKRGEIWAVLEDSQRQMMRALSEQFHKALSNPIIDPNCPPGTIWGLSKALMEGEHYDIKIEYGMKDAQQDTDV